MSKERRDKIVSDKANTVVTNEENNFRSTHIALAKALIKSGAEKQSKEEIDILKAETERTKPLPYDEEEKTLYDIYTKDKKK